jgi:outer membrane protein OmpA-like peptidoglycan-associated protein
MKQIKLCAFLLVAFFWQNANAQEQLGWLNDNYAGVNSIDLQPANIVDSRFKFDMSLIHFNASLQNNYVGFKRWAIKNDENDDRDFQDRALFERIDDSKNKNVYLNFQSSLPVFNFMFNINRKNALAITTKSRTMINIDNLEPELAKLAWESLEFPPLWQKRLTNENLNINAMSWGEVGITYGREIFTINDHYLKGSLRVKYLMGLAAAYLQSDRLEYEFKNDDTLSIYNSDVRYGFASNINDNLYEDFSFEIPGKPTFGYDFGFVYEWRKNADEKYKYDMDGKEGLWRRDKNKYILKAGFSVLDLGRVRFDKSVATGNFNADITEWDISNFDADGIDGFNDTINNRFTRTADEGDFKMKLPTSISYQLDWHIWKPFYLNHTGFIGVKRDAKEARLRNVTTYSVAPRIEFKWLGLSFPYSYQPDFQQHRIGTMLRLGPIVLGTDNLLNFVGNDVIYGGDVYVALKMPILFKKPKDKDGDKVSNKKDNCKTVSGPWSNKGCPLPDADGDGIMDSDDACPNEKGIAEFKGCPDSDADGIQDREDECPTLAGTAENRGCPDTDGDGVIDKGDQCPTEGGPLANKGCPWPDADKDGVLDKDDQCPDVPGSVDNSGCPDPDTDGDGIPDRLDKCPRTPGTPENQGCPKLEQKEQEILDKAFDNLEFQSGTSVIKTASLDELKALAGLLKTKPNAKLLISGHTDNVGKTESNLLLSKNRANAVKNYLIKEGVAISRLITEWFGAAQPIADNATPEGRAKNRRVEMKLLYE